MLAKRIECFVRGSWYQRTAITTTIQPPKPPGVNFIFISSQGVIFSMMSHFKFPRRSLNSGYGYNRFISLADQEPDARGIDLTQLGFPRHTIA